MSLCPVCGDGSAPDFKVCLRCGAKLSMSLPKSRSSPPRFPGPGTRKVKLFVGGPPRAPVATRFGGEIR